MSETDIDKARSVLLGFMTEMNAWEKKYYPLLTADAPQHRASALSELESIYVKYLTQKERKTGRLAGPDVGDPPEYDPLKDEIENVTEDSPGTVLITLQSHTGFKVKSRFKIKTIKQDWRIDTKEEYFKSTDKWKNHVF